ncbi:MAG TPA: hypothetical protein PKH24_07130 [Sedimentisphaerales bacterium]|jgi:hypothetical protein|nr:hypothetical protein [Sedimentisphaerales bacterium]HNU29452.1 hypothetical protein [Sedimentisphaerales bacterium]
MKKTCTGHRWLWIALTLTGLAATAGIGLCQIQPSGRNAGLIQFDVISEMNLDLTRDGNLVVFTRCWVCEDYYAASVVWTEPHGGLRDMKTTIVFSDKDAFRMDNDHHSSWVPINTTYAKPLGERPAFRWGGGFYGSEEMRFAEAEALARRVYVTDLGTSKGLKPDAEGVVEVNVPKGPDNIARRLARLRVRARDDRIESMELLGNHRQSLAQIRYEYEQGTSPAPLATLVAELPVRPETLGLNATVTLTDRDGNQRTHNVPDVNYVSHKGGRTCTVTYQDVKAGDKTLRLPVRITVQRSDNKRLVRSARLMNFKRVTLDKDEVQAAARAFGMLDGEYPTLIRLVDKFLEHEARLGPPPVDPNDLTVVRRLIARYPMWEQPAPPRPSEPTPVTRPLPEQMETTREDWLKQIEAKKREQAEQREQVQKWRQEVAKMPRPPRKEVKPDDVRLIRQLDAYYAKRFSTIQGTVPEDESELWNLSRKLPEILRYHRVSPLPEDQPPEPNDLDRALIRRLRTHYEKCTARQDQGLGGQFKALDALIRLDLIVKDYDAYEGHVARYLQMLRDADLNEMYMAGGHRHIAKLVEVGQYEKADRLFRQWADRSAAVNDADGIFRFCGMSLGGRADPWAAVQLLDRFLKRSGLSAVERYETLAWRAIAFDKMDKLLADPDPDDESHKAQARWMLRGATRADIAAKVQAAILEAVSAWGALGPARLSEAKPYSTASMSTQMRNAIEAPDATRLQETSAELDQIVRQRTAQRGAASRPSEVKPSERSSRQRTGSPDKDKRGAN